MEDSQEASLYKPVASWDADDVAAWVRGLDESLSAHIPQFLAHSICGSDLLKMNKTQLQYLQVDQMGHQELILEAVEHLLALDLSCTHNPTMSLVSTLSKKTSQLITLLDRTTPVVRMGAIGGGGGKRDSRPELSRVDIAADVMMSARSLINWLDRNPTNLVLDYSLFRQAIIKDAQELANISEREEGEEEEGGEERNFNRNMVEACRRILRQTQVMMSPQNFSLVEPIRLQTVPLCPSPTAGLGISFQRTKQGNLVVNGIKPESPAALCDKIRLGDELIQINNQNVVGWQVISVVQLLKHCGHEIVMVFKVGLLHSKQERQQKNKDEKRESKRVSRSHDVQEQPTNGIAAEEESGDSLDGLVDEVAMSRLQRTSLSPGSDSDVSSPSSTPPMSDSEKHKKLKLKWSASNPIADSDRSKVEVGRARRLLDGAAAVEETDGGNGRKSVSFEERLKRRTSSEIDLDPQKQLPPVAYRTQIVGGVVMRIPIKPEDQGSPKPKRGGGGKKAKGKKSPVTHTPVDADVEKGKVVFTDPKEILVDGQATKQITVASTGEPQYTSKEAAPGHKRCNPALVVPCFQLKDVDYEGWMYKMGGTGFTPRNWRRRWFVLKGGRLYYYKTSFDVTATGIVDLVGYMVEAAVDIKKKNCFKAVQEGMRTYYFQADSSDQMLMWMKKLSEACRLATATATHPPQSIEEAQSEDELSDL